MVRAPRKNKNPQRIQPIAEPENDSINQPDFTFSNFGKETNDDQALEMDKSNAEPVDEVKNFWRVMAEYKMQNEKKEMNHGQFSPVEMPMNPAPAPFSSSCVEKSIESSVNQGCSINNSVFIGSPNQAAGFSHQLPKFKLSSPPIPVPNSQAHHNHSASLELQNLVPVSQNTPDIPIHICPLADVLRDPYLREQLAKIGTGTSDQPKFLYPVKTIPAPPFSKTVHGQFQQISMNSSLDSPTNNLAYSGSTYQLPEFKIYPSLRAPNLLPEYNMDSASPDLPLRSNLVPAKRRYVKYRNPKDTSHLPINERPVGDVLRKLERRGILDGITLRPSVRTRRSKLTTTPSTPAQRSDLVAGAPQSSPGNLSINEDSQGKDGNSPSA